jgi:hypothetical protein
MFFVAWHVLGFMPPLKSFTEKRVLFSSGGKSFFQIVAKVKFFTREVDIQIAVDSLHSLSL